MHKVIVSKKINKSAKRVWEAIDDFGEIYRFHPLVESSSIINGVETGLGSERQCNFYDKGAIKERITDYQDQKGMTFEIFEFGSIPLNEAVANISVEPMATNKTEVRFEMNFEPKFGPVGWLMAKVLMKSQFAKTIGQILGGLKSHLETGKTVGKKGVLIEALAV